MIFGIFHKVSYREVYIEDFTENAKIIYYLLLSERRNYGR